MAIYRPIPHHRAGIIDDPEVGISATAETIIFPEVEGHDTGLLDAQGNRLFRFRDPVGFRVPRA